MIDETCCHGDATAGCEWLDGHVETAIGPVPHVGTRWTRRDRIGAWAVCWGIGRMRYRVPPGLYAVGKPSPDTPLLVTANYKVSFDHVRRALEGRDAWILVLDTKGVNVWCAAGKGTFGTAELISRIESCGVFQVVAHRTLILPQLGAPGMAAHEVSRKTGFKVVYGPVRASDIPAFLNAGMKATPDMRRANFMLRERLARTPIELVRHFIPAVLAALLFVALSGLGRQGYRILPEQAIGVVTAVFCVYLVGIVLTPVLLPWLPCRAFACKGAITGALAGGLLGGLGPWGRLGGLSIGLLSIAVCSLLGLMFTGSTHYTSASGVRSELRWALPLQGALATVGLFGWIVSRFI